MPTSPYAKLRVAKNGGAVASGAIAAAHGDSIQLSSEDVASIRAFRFEIFEYPAGFTCPAGWSTDSGGVYFYAGGATPPAFTLPASTALWGHYLFRLTVNDGNPGTTGLPWTQFVDDSTAINIPESAGSGVEDIGFGENKQFDSQRGWLKALKTNLRLLAVGLGAGFGSAAIADHAVTHVKYQTIAGQKILANSTGSTGNVQEVGLTNGLEFTSTNIGIANKGVSYARIQDVSAQARLLGRGGASGVGAVEELTVTGGLEFNGTALRRSALVGDVTAAAGSNTTAIATNVVNPTTHLTQVASLRFLGRLSASTGNWEVLTGTQATSMLVVFTSSNAGLVPGSGGGTANFLRADGVWAAPSGSFTAPASPGDNGKLAYASSGTVAYSANITTDGTSIGFGAVASLPAGSARLKFVGNSVVAVVKSTLGGSDIVVASVDASDRVSFGANAINAFYNATSSHAWYVGANPLLTLNAITLGVAPAALTTGASSPILSLVAPAHTGLTASGETRDYTFNSDRVVTRAAGAVTNQRFMSLRVGTLAFDGASVVSIAAGLSISRAPVAGTNATITNALGLWMEDGCAIGFGGVPSMARTGHIRTGHNLTLWAGRLQDDSADVALIRWGSGTNNELRLGNTAIGNLALSLGGSSQLTIQYNGVLEYEITAAQFDFKSNNLVGVAQITGSFYGNEIDDGNSGAADTIDWSAGPNHKSTLNGNPTYTFTAPAQHKHLQLRMVWSGSGRDPTWPATVKWVGGVEPLWNTADGAVNIATFYWDGTTYWGTGASGFA